MNNRSKDSRCHCAHGAALPGLILKSVVLCKVSGRLLHHMEAVTDIQEYASAAKTLQCRRLLRKLDEIRKEAPWGLPVPLVCQWLPHSCCYYCRIQISIRSTLTVVGFHDDRSFFIYSSGQCSDAKDNNGRIARSLARRGVGAAQAHWTSKLCHSLRRSRGTLLSEH